MPNLAILGAAGAVGRNLAAEFARRGTPFLAVGRSREKLDAAFRDNPLATAASSDLANAESTASTLRGVETAIYAVGVPYQEFERHPVLMQSAVNACSLSGVRKLIVVSNVYSYGAPRTPRVSEEHPREPAAHKGKMRKQQEDIALAAEGLRTLVLRLPDFYGLFADLSITTPVINAALRNMAAPWIGPVDAPHEFIFLPDAAVAMADLCDRDELFGRAWNLGGAGTITPREFVERVYAEVGVKPRIRNGKKLFLLVAGAFSSLMRELYEMYYLQDTPVILDDSALQKHLPLSKTPYSEGIPATIRWIRGEAR
jgi:nucleoside-diphosphate-sugar epimerase